MKLYVVKEVRNDFNEEVFLGDIYGVFSSSLKANKIKEDLEKANERDNGTMEYQVVEVELDKPTEVFYIMLSE